MNLYVVVEGELGAKRIYEEWISHFNPSLSKVGHISEINSDNFCVLHAGGRPEFFSVIKAAIEDVNNHGNIDKIVVCVDSEEAECQDAIDEMQGFCDGKVCAATKCVVIQHYCFESWALGNRVLFKRKPQHPKLRTYLAHYNVAKDDPELMPAIPSERLNRAQFSSKYLRYLLNERFRNLTYNKNDPQPLLNPKYFIQLQNRLTDTGHISSLQFFMDAFS